MCPYFVDWSSMLADAPPANLIILNPNDGPDPGYASQVSAAHAKGARVLGYVYTGWAGRASTSSTAMVRRRPSAITRRCLHGADRTNIISGSRRR